MSYLKCFNCKNELGWDKDDYAGTLNVGDRHICEACDIWCCGRCFIMSTKKMKILEDELFRHIECNNSVDLT